MCAARASVEGGARAEGLLLVESLTATTHTAHFLYTLSASQHVIDGDLCEAFAVLPSSKQKQMAGDLSRSIGEVAKKLEEMRAKLF